MKNLSLLCLSVLLAACGAGENTSTNSTVLLESVSRPQIAAKIPVVATGERRAYDIKWSQGILSGAARSPELRSFQLSSFEVRLPDISLSYDKDGLTGQLFRLYQATFGRTPDVGGFGFWKDALENKGMTLGQVADEFLNSAESKALYGSQVVDSVFVDRLYRNVLHRTPDTAGATYWLDILKTGTKRANVLLSFADSKENKDATATGIDAGMAFAEPGVAYIPVSNAAAPSDVLVGATVEIDGSVSTDANGDVLQYSWTFPAKPSGSSAILSSATVAKVKLILDKSGTYELALRVSDATAQSYSPAKVTIVAHALVADSGKYTCSSITASQAQLLFSTGHTYLDRDKDGIACDAADVAYEKAPTVPPVADTGTFKCSTISHELAVLLYMQGHTYLDRDHDGKPCEATDINVEKTVYVPPPTTPSPPSTGKCWVNGYTRKDGTHVSGYWRSC
jgi:hypothetical protein